MNCALLSRWHVHADEYAAEAKELGLNIVAVWDEDSTRGDRWAKELGVAFRANLDDVLSDPQVDAVIVTTPTTMHPEVLTKAARAGKHIFTEKVLATTVAECDAILSAVDAAGVTLMLSLPRLTDDYFLAAQQAVADGLVGDVTLVRCRFAHDGAVATEAHPQGWLPDYFFDPALCGGGAFVDLGAHAIYLTHRLAGGQPQSVTGYLAQTQGRGVDDNAAIVAEYERGTLAIMETGFVSGGSPFLLEVHGTTGSVLVEDGRVRLASRQGKQEMGVPEGRQVRRDRPMKQWVDWIERDIAPVITRDDMRNLTRINEAAAESARTGARVYLL